MHVLRRWSNHAAPIGFVPAAYRDRDAMFIGEGGCSVSSLLMLWNLGGQAFCFNAKNGVLHIGLVKVPVAKAKARRQETAAAPKARGRRRR